MNGNKSAAIGKDSLNLNEGNHVGRRFDEAEAQARKALEIDPRFFLAHYYLGQVLQFTGRPSEAIAEYQKAFDLTNDPYPLAALVRSMPEPEG